MFFQQCVVVSGEMQNGFTGSEKEAIIAIYTGTGVGTALHGV